MTNISISVGPGQNGSLIVETLATAGLLKQALWTFPELAIENIESNERKIEVFRSFGLLQRSVWAAWRRVPHYKYFETPRSWLLPLADRIFANRLVKCDLFIGWLQVSLSSMLQAKQFGARVVLEHQMSHISTWTDLVTEEYRAWGEGRTGFHSVFPDRMVKRINEEYETADFINVLSNYSKQSFIDNGINQNKIAITPFGVDSIKFTPGTFRRGGAFRILYVGRLELLKGIQYLLRAFVGIKRKDVELIMVGPILPEILPILKKFQDDRVTVTGGVSRDRLVEYYRDADVLVFPSINDAFGLVVLEAMSCGVPVIATDHSCGEDLVTDGEDGFIVNAKNSDQIKERLCYMMENPVRSIEMGAKARKKVESGFTIDHYRNRYLEMCSRVIG